VVEPDAVARRILSLNEALGQLSRPEAGDPQRLRSDPVLRAAVERWLQIAIEACIDVAYHVVASNEWTPPETARGAFSTLQAHGLISAALAERLGNAAAMRNVLVHDYAELDLDRVARAVRTDLDDLREFAGIVGGLLDAGG
jgi:uncharacterized protein YutE (UPF0331/DUF86 family)